MHVHGGLFEQKKREEEAGEGGGEVCGRPEKASSIASFKLVSAHPSSPGVTISIQGWRCSGMSEFLWLERDTLLLNLV